MRKDMTALQWLAPSMARDGLIRNSEWIPQACDTAVGLFADNRLHLPATLLAALSPFAIDYIKQAPALVLAAAWDARLIYRKERLRVAHRFIAASGSDPDRVRTSRTMFGSGCCRYDTYTCGSGSSCIAGRMLPTTPTTVMFAARGPSPARM